MVTQQQKAQLFSELHKRKETFVIPNPWDQGSAVILQNLGFKALATTSAGYAQSMGRLDGQVTLEEKLLHCRLLAEVTDIPINADFENGFADDPGSAAANLIKVAETGVVGASIEDYSGSGIYDFDLSVERIAACAQAVATLGFPFLLTARAENLLRGVTDMDDTIKRLQAYSAAGADVLYAPGLVNPDQVRAVLSEVDKPLNVLAPFMPDVSLDEFRQLGVGRVSIGGALANFATGATIDAAKRMAEGGSFEWVKDAASGGTIRKLLKP